jgi:copper chaperone CopZ
MITVHVPAMTARQDIRAISACISDIPGVQTLRADLATSTVQVTGSADPAAITAAVTAAGYPAVDCIAAAATDGSPPTGAPGETTGSSHSATAHAQPQPSTHPTRSPAR